MLRDPKPITSRRLYLSLSRSLYPDLVSNADLLYQLEEEKVSYPSLEPGTRRNGPAVSFAESAVFA